jgi:predicted membrane protein
MEKEDIQDIKSWRISAVVMLIIALSLFFYQQFINKLFDDVFSLFIFYIPAVISVVLYLAVKKSSSAKYEDATNPIMR